MSTPHNPGDPSSQQSANQPWGQQSANQPEGQAFGQQSADPYAGQPQWGGQQQPSSDQWGGQQADPYAGQYAGQQADPYAGQYAGQQADPYAGQYAGQQQWGGQPQQPGLMSSDGKSFFSSLFDFSFQSFVTPKIIKVVYVVITALIGLGIVFFIIGSLVTGEALPIIAALILGPLVGLIYLALARMSLELYYAVIRLAEDVHERLPRQ